MGLRINTNIMSLQAQRYLQQHTWRVQKSMERLASGLRINRGADDPAGLAMSEKLKHQIAALEVANRNAADGISLVQTAEGSYDTVSEMLIRMKELGVQSLNGALDDQQRSYLDKEFQSLKDEIDRVAASADFNGVHLLDGSAGTLSLMVGLSGSDALAIDLGADSSAAGLGLGGLDILQATDGSARAAIDGIDAAIDLVSGRRADLGAQQNRLESVIRLNSNLGENLSAANSRIRDVDVAREMSELTSAQILQQAAVAVLAQANSQPNLILALLQRSFGWR